ncbi:MAG: type I pullulanase [Solobacterium sp.]|nr:type I pullulanase [Solobacterium sp.]
MKAFLDDFGRVQVCLSKDYYNGSAGGFYITGENGMCSDCVIRGVEEHDREIWYNLTIPAEFQFGQVYTIHESHGKQVPLQIRHIVRTAEFDRQFTYHGDDLGAEYTRENTNFALWAPTAVHAYVRLISPLKQVTVHVMTRTDKGVFRICINGDLSSFLYTFLIERDGIMVESIDPYGLSSDANSQHSAVIDRSRIEEIPDPGTGLVMNSATDAIIYECSVRDMTSSKETGTATNGKFISLSESGTSWKLNPTGLDYLADLGVTHVQLQPVMDFLTVDENHPDRGYNWGYDPEQFFALEGSYSTDADDPYCRVTEFRRMIAALHAKGLKVTLDVVFNHMYDVGKSPFDRIVPYYYFRYTDNGWLSNGSYCGNDLDSKRPMMRKLILDVIRTYMSLYNIDGFRFDLMGILDVDTMNEIYRTARSIKPDVLIYGEGWDMPTALAPEEKAKIYNQHHMPGIGHFNDSFRDICKGKTSDDSKYDKGYLTGNLGMAFDMCSALSGNSKGDPYFLRFDNPAQSVNALETHDNATAWDKMHMCCGEEPREIRMKRQKLLLAATMLAQGIPFIHQGMEFCGTKQDNTNSYNSGDSINQMNWDRMILYYDIVIYTRKMIALRRKYRAFRLETGAQMQKYVHFHLADGYIVFYDIDYPDAESASGGLRVIFNPSLNDHYFHFDTEYEIIADENGIAKPGLTAEIRSPQCSCIVLSKPLKTG